jgi:UDP-N-acetylglucosamine transferase subunit ALG13
MIFVTVGTCEPFDRLMRGVDSLPVSEVVFVQTGLSSVVPQRATTVEFLPYDALVDLVREARLVVTHAGVGTILTALLNGVKPIVVPRLKKYGDAVDDHQLELAERLADLKLVTLVRETSELADAVREGTGVTEEIQIGTALVNELRDYIAVQAA